MFKSLVNFVKEKLVSLLLIVIVLLASFVGWMLNLLNGNVFPV